MKTQVITIYQPSIQRGKHCEPQKETVREIIMERNTNRAMCDVIYGRCGNYPESTIQHYPWWRETGMFTMSIGSVIVFRNEPNKAYICDTYGFLKVTLEQAKDWLNWKGERGPGDMFAIEQWKKRINVGPH